MKFEIENNILIKCELEENETEEIVMNSCFLMCFALQEV